MTALAFTLLNKKKGRRAGGLKYLRGLCGTRDPPGPSDDLTPGISLWSWGWPLALRQGASRTFLHRFAVGVPALREEHRGFSLLACVGGDGARGARWEPIAALFFEQEKLSTQLDLARKLHLFFKPRTHTNDLRKFSM